MRQLNIRITDAEYKALDFISKRMGTTKTMILRMMLQAAVNNETFIEFESRHMNNEVARSAFQLKGAAAIIDGENLS